MAFEILNEAASVLYVLAGENRYPQAEPDKVDFDILAQAHNSEGVISGCAVTPQGIPDTTVAVAAGVVRIGGRDVAYAGGNVNCGAAHAAFPRFDLIIVNNAGAASAVNGVAAEPPAFPAGAAVPGTSVVIAAVWRAANDNTIVAADIVDKRCMLLGGALGTAPTNLGIVGGIATPNRSHHTMAAQAGAADDLDGLAVSSIITNGEIVIIRPDAGDTITVKHNALGGADARNILCIGNADIVLDDDHDFAICIYSTAIGAGSWMALGGGAAGGYDTIKDEGAAEPQQSIMNFIGGLVFAQDDVPNAETEIYVGCQPDGTNLFVTANAAPHCAFGGAINSGKQMRIRDNLVVGDGVHTLGPGVQWNVISLGAIGATQQSITPVIVGTLNQVVAENTNVASFLAAARGIQGSAAVVDNFGTFLGMMSLGLQFDSGISGSGDLYQQKGIYVSCAGAAWTGRDAPGWLGATGIHLLPATGYHAASAQVYHEGILIEDQGHAGVTSVYSLKINSLTAGTNRYGIHAGDIAGGAIARILELGPATPHLRLEGTGEWAPAINTAETPLLLIAGNNDNPLTRTLRRVQWMDPGAGGANFAGGERVMILV